MFFNLHSVPLTHLFSLFESQSISPPQPRQRQRVPHHQHHPRRQQQQETGRHDALFHSLRQLCAAAEGFQGDEGQVTAIQGGQREQVDDGQVDVDDGGELMMREEEKRM